jgi:hypothetical protein
MISRLVQTFALLFCVVAATGTTSHLIVNQKYDVDQCTCGDANCTQFVQDTKFYVPNRCYIQYGANLSHAYAVTKASGVYSISELTYLNSDCSGTGVATGSAMTHGWCDIVPYNNSDDVSVVENERWFVLPHFCNSVADGNYTSQLILETYSQGSDNCTLNSSSTGAVVREEVFFADTCAFYVNSDTDGDLFEQNSCNGTHVSRHRFNNSDCSNATDSADETFAVDTCIGVVASLSSTMYDCSSLPVCMSIDGELMQLAIDAQAAYDASQADNTDNNGTSNGTSTGSGDGDGASSSSGGLGMSFVLVLFGVLALLL